MFTSSVKKCLKCLQLVYCNRFSSCKCRELQLYKADNNRLPQFIEALIDLVTVFDAILMSRQTREKLRCLYENLMLNNFHSKRFCAV